MLGCALDRNTPQMEGGREEDLQGSRQVISGHARLNERGDEEAVKA